MRLVVTILAAALAVIAFPPFGWGIWAVVPGLAGLIWALDGTKGWWRGALYGLVWGFVFYGGLMWWMATLELVAAVGLALLQAFFAGLFGAISTTRWAQSLPPWRRWLLVVGLWAGAEWLRYRYPLGGLEWGALGYALGEHRWLRGTAAWVGTSGLTVLVAATASIVSAPTRIRITALAGFVALLLVGALFPGIPNGPEASMAVVQGATPCPFQHCPDERLGTYRLHLASSQQLPGDTFELVVWSEGSLGSTNADPTKNPEVAESIADEVRRLDSHLLAGSDRVLSEDTWENVNIMWNPDGTIQD
ncbi:MAG: hypothetical protein GEU79_17140, partial [Acidimicrobiia bacterium]|nr:hypothetical protein [Acidimicrobiia bacterium]